MGFPYFFWTNIYNSAKAMFYNNTDSQLIATNVEEAITELVLTADSAGATSVTVRNSNGDIIHQIISSGITITGITNTNGRKLIKNSSNVTQIDLDSTVGITNKLGRIDAGIVNVNSATYDMLATDLIAHVTYTTTGAITSLTLPSARSAEQGRLYTIKDAGFNASINNITIDTEGSEKIDGQDTLVIASNGDSVSLYAYGGNWFIY